LPVIASVKTASGPLGNRENANNQGGKLVVELGTSLKAHRTNPMFFLSRSRVVSSHFADHIFNVPINLSQSPVCWGRSGTLKFGLQPSIFKNVVVNLLVKFDTQSDQIVVGRPVI